MRTWPALPAGRRWLTCGLTMMVLPWVELRRLVAVMLTPGLVTLAVFATAAAEPLLDETVRAAILKLPDGPAAHVESEFNDIYITKRGNELTMSFQLKGWHYTESV